MLITCIQIFFARFFDVTLGTVRSYFSVKGKTFISASIAFVEVMIWFIAAREALVNTYDSILIPIFYSLGFATGTFFGTFITNRFVNRLLSVQVVTKKNNTKMINLLHKNGYALSAIPLRKVYDDNEKELLLIEAKQQNSNNLINLIKASDKKAFIIINESRVVENGLIKK